MGLAASQARYLALTARKSDLEYQSQTINTRRMQLAYKTADIAAEYSSAMNNSRICYSIKGEKETKYKALTFDSILQQGCVLIGINGAGLDPQPYKVTNNGKKTSYLANRAVTLTSAQYTDLSDTDKMLFLSNGEAENPTYSLKSELTSEEEIDARDASSTYKIAFTEINTCSTTISHDEAAYESSACAQDVENLLRTGQAVLVTRGFFNFLVANGYNYQTGLSPSQYRSLLDQWESQTAGVNSCNADAVVSWQSDPHERFLDRNYTEDDAAALSRYEAATAEIQKQDKALEIEEKNIETQHKAIETEMEYVKKVIQKNMEETFKIFS